MTMWAYWVPLRYTPKMVTVVNFIMCILLQFKKKKTNSQERAEQEKVAATGFWKLAILLVVGRSEKAQLQAGSGESKAPVHFQHRILQKLGKCCFWMEGWDSLQGTGLELSEKQRISPPPPFHAAGCCWVTVTLYHRTLENHFLQNRNQETVLSMWSEQTRAKTRRYYHQGSQPIAQLKGSWPDQCWWDPSTLSELSICLVSFITHRQPLILRCEKNASSIKEIYKKNETGKKSLGRNKLHRRESFKKYIVNILSEIKKKLYCIYELRTKC